MTRFKKGDLVRRTIGGPKEEREKGREFFVARVDSDGDVWDENNVLHLHRSLELVNPKWEPQKGETILVWLGGNEAITYKREFFAMDGDSFVCRTLVYENTLYVWPNAKPVQKDTTITLATGENLELSQESYDLLVRAVKG